jgi:hypothetical protein
MEPQEPHAKFGKFQDAPQVLAPLPGHIDSVEAVALQPWKQLPVCVCPEMWDLPRNNTQYGLLFSGENDDQAESSINIWDVPSPILGGTHFVMC